MLGSVDQLTGKKLGKYQLGQLLGQGSVTAIYVAQIPGQAHMVMLTILILPKTCVGPACERFLTRFKQEATALSTLRHPHIVPLYDFDILDNYPYFVTPLNEGNSLASLLKQQTRCTTRQVLALLKQIAEGLDYAHSNNIVHGTLKPSHILLDSKQNVSIGGFGLGRMLEMRNIGSIKHTHPQLFSVAGTFLTNSEYLAPEVVLGAQPDARSDIYALGAMLFEMFSGHPPFTGSDPLAVAMQQVEQRIPSLHAVCPDLPGALDIVLQRALERDPSHRVQSAGKLLTSFERVLNVMHEATNTPPPLSQEIATDTRITLPPSVDWLMDEASSASRPGAPLFTFSKLPAIKNPVTPPINKPPVAPDPAQSSFDPFVWAATGTSIPVPEVQEPQADSLQVQTKPRIKAVKKPVAHKGRRALLIASGSIVATGVLGFAGYNLLRQLQHSGVGSSQALTQRPGHPQNAQSGTRQTPTATTPGAPPTSTSAPAHQGKVIANTTMANNTAITFSKSATSPNSILIHLSNGNFVAYDATCTHEGATVMYSTTMQKLVCPRHNAQFDPANNAQVLDGPAPTPLKPVAIHVNADGTITVG